MFVLSFIKIPFAVFGWSNWTRKRARERDPTIISAHRIASQQFFFRGGQPFLFFYTSKLQANDQPTKFLSEKGTNEEKQKIDLTFFLAEFEKRNKKGISIVCELVCVYVCFALSLSLCLRVCISCACVCVSSVQKWTYSRRIIEIRDIAK